MRTIIWFIYFWAVFIKWIPALYRVKHLQRSGRIQERDELVVVKVKEWSRSLVKLSGSKITVSGEENIPKDTAVLFVSNHQGNFDIPLLLGYLQKPKAFISKIEVKKVPFIGTWMEQLNCLFMDRKNVRQSVKAISEGAQFLRNGTSLVIFPEGTRSKGDEMAEFKAGSFKLATKSGVPIIPVTINGSYKMMEQQGFWIKPANVHIEVHPPIYPQKQEAKDLAKLSQLIIKEGVKKAVS
ncbi:1-acyl-sn-glycerol-3-phosphate acyltransferase [Fictibacillus nanhaiensis]|uniref:lysophospholipid acyltransferase family protein n=1 Tax=Fictibacillus nanhaiensis TaxID=742169 RepID=UPI00203E8B15|nr:lysophospholipid acyltransferase family protein [Fictibacillus nanhaiensis]MCM3731891.1 1-acyl-sn-glycerol-3-phosphate acyltransferase [Fictibacillus nanhaiensis]